MAKIVLKNVRGNFFNLFEPKGFNGQKEKYSMQVIVPKNHPQIADLSKAVLDAAKDKFAAKIKGDKLPFGLKNPMRDGDVEREDQDEFKGAFFFNASSLNRPVALDRAKHPVTQMDGVFYSGCYVNVSLNTYSFDVSGSRGVAIGLNGVQFLKDGEPLSGFGNAMNDFEVLDDDTAGSGDESYLG